MSMKRENLAFILLINCLLLITLSFTLLPATWTVPALAVAVVLGILSGGLYAASVQKQK
jgi:hypothetical protein